MASGSSLCQGTWLSVQEERLLLQDGLNQLVNCIPVPTGVVKPRADLRALLQARDGRAPSVVNQKLTCYSTKYDMLVEYRLSALETLWVAILGRECVVQELPSTVCVNTNSDFPSRMGLLLLFPVLRSLSKLDCHLSHDVSSLLLKSLKDCEPLSLSCESAECISGLEDLLSSWLNLTDPTDHAQLQCIASALVTLAVAVGTEQMLLKTIHLLHKLVPTSANLHLFVPGVLRKLLRKSLNEDKCYLVTSKSRHYQCWSVGDGMQLEDKGTTAPPCSLAINRQFLFMTGSSNNCMVKVGTGRNGSFQGLVYAQAKCEPGWVVFVQGKLLHISKDYVCSVVDQTTLKSCSEVQFSFKPEEHLETLQFVSDGDQLLWLYIDNQNSPPSVVVQRLLVGEEGEGGSSGETICCGEQVLLHVNGAQDTSKLPKDESATSCGLPVKALRSCAAYATSCHIVLVVELPAVKGARGSNPSRVSRASHCFCLNSGKFLTHSEFPQCLNFTCGVSGRTAACYDFHSHSVWASCAHWIGAWHSPGKTFVPAQRLAHSCVRRSVNEQLVAVDDNSLPLSAAISMILDHVGLQSCLLVPGVEAAIAYKHSYPLSFLEQCCDLLENSLSEGRWSNCLSLLVSLQVLLPGFLDTATDLLKQRTSSILWGIVCLKYKNCPNQVLTETRWLLSCSFVLFEEGHVSALNGNGLSCVDPSMSTLRELLLSQIAQDLQMRAGLPSSVLKFCPLLKGRICEDSVSAIAKCSQLTSQELQGQHPVLTPSLVCAAALLSASLRGLTASKTSSTAPLSEESYGDVLLLLAETKLFEACRKTLADVAAYLKDKKEPDLVSLERAAKSTVLGCLLLPLLTFLSDAKPCPVTVANRLLGELHPLYEMSSEVCGCLPQVASISVPAPWAATRLMETAHPVTDGYKYKDTISFPGAQNLYLKFDPRCSSQYDYDRVMVYAGDSPQCSKVAEYGGNTHGYGSRKVLGKGWPVDLVKVEGSAVTITFEMRSGRERTTPDHAMWGFACSVQPQEAVEEACQSIPFLTDLQLSLISTACCLVKSIYCGPEVSLEEQKCQFLASSKLLQRCKWQNEETFDFSSASLQSVRMCPVSAVPSQSPLPSSVMKRLRDVAGKPQPVLRKTTQEVVRPELLEDVLMSVCLKHCGMGSTLLLLGKEDPESIEQSRAFLDAVFTHINGLERRLQVLVELEMNWWHDVEDLVSGCKSYNEAFFNSLQHESPKHYELLCCLKGVDVSSGSLLHTTVHQQLLECLLHDVEKAKQSAGEEAAVDRTPLTRKLMEGVLQRGKLLLCVSLVEDGRLPTATESSNSSGDASGLYMRSLSAPDSHYLAKQRRSTFLDVSYTHSVNHGLLDEIFQFVGCKPDEVVSPDAFLSAAAKHWHRSVCRMQALEWLNRLLAGQQQPVLGVEHLLSCSLPVLQDGPQKEGVLWGGMVQQVVRGFSRVVELVVRLAGKQPSACIDSIAKLCTIPYSNLEEECLACSGLIPLLDRLCNQPCEEGCSAWVSPVAWAGFQVLAESCLSWDLKRREISASILACQVSLLMTNYISRKMDCLKSTDDSSLLGALSFLLDFSKSDLGRAILCQPACVSKLLQLLVDERPSPKLVSIVLQLCRLSLPLLRADECSQISFPACTLPCRGDSVAANIVYLLLAKLAEYIVPNVTLVQVTGEEGDSPKPTQTEDMMDKSGLFSVYVHSNGSQEALDLLVKERPDRFQQGSSRMQEVEKLLKNSGRAEVMCDCYDACVELSLRLAELGLTASVETHSVSPGTSTDKKKAEMEEVVRKRNVLLSRMCRPKLFLSGSVAYSLASEVIGVMHDLLADPQSLVFWKTAIRESFMHLLAAVPGTVPELSRVLRTGAGLPSDLMQSVCLANATFAALGGFRVSVQPGTLVQVEGHGLQNNCYGKVLSISEHGGLTQVQFADDKFCFGPNQSLEVPLSRLAVPQAGSLSLNALEVGERLCGAFVSLLSIALPPDHHPSSPPSSTNNSPFLSLCRLVKEMQTRLCMAISCHVRCLSESDYLCDAVMDTLRHLAQDCDAGLRLTELEAFCQELRLLYKDCSKPTTEEDTECVLQPSVGLDAKSPLSPLSHCSFTHDMTCVCYQGPRQKGKGLPTGVILYTDKPVSLQSKSFYWEVELLELGGAGSSDCDVAAVGYSPSSQGCSQEDEWDYPPNTCLLTSRGRAKQLCQPPLECEALDLERPLGPGDVVGCGLVRDGSSTVVYFTLNGHELQRTFSGDSVQVLPFLHLMEKSVRVRVNFGDRPFTFTDGHTHRNAFCVNDTESVLDVFSVLPFACECDPESDCAAVETTLDPGPSARVLQAPDPTREYNWKRSSSYLVQKSFDNILEAGPFVRPGLGGGAGLGGASLVEEEWVSCREDDLHSLLVKAWEAKVFPVIQRRFRNDQERKSGLEQIRGALHLGMENIARETVEFLYEENGGAPGDLHFPNMEEIKADLQKFSIGHLQSGSVVVISKELPHGVKTMEKTAGLTGTVVSVDKQNKLVLVDCYLKNEGTQARFWYPVACLERPAPGYGKRSLLHKKVDGDSLLTHRELLSCESSLTKIHCRKALMSLSSSPTEPDSVLKHLQMLSCDCFSEPQVDGSCSTTSPLHASTPSALLHCLQLSPLHLFYRDPGKIEQAIEQAVTSCVDDLKPLTRAMCQCLVEAPEGFHSLELEAEGKEAMDFVCPGAAFTAVCCVDGSSPPQSEVYKHPWAQVFCYRGVEEGNRKLQAVAQFPTEMPQYCGPAYPSLVLPFSSLHVRLNSSSAKPGKKIVVSGLPSAFPLCLAYVHTLSLCVLRPEGPGRAECAKSLAKCVEALICLLSQYDCQCLLKELLFHLMAESLGVLLATPQLQILPTIPSEFVESLKEELAALCQREGVSFTRSSGAAGGSFWNGRGVVHSTYFQSLLELVVQMDRASPVVGQGSDPSSHGEVGTKHRATEHDAPAAQPRRTSSRLGAQRRKEATQQDSRGKWIASLASCVKLMCAVDGKRSMRLRTPSSLPTQTHARLLVVGGIDPSVEAHQARRTVHQTCRMHGCTPRGQVTIFPAGGGSGNGDDNGTGSSCAVLELMSSNKALAVATALSSALKTEGSSIAVSTVRGNLKCEREGQCDVALERYLRERLLKGAELVPLAADALREIFLSSCVGGGEGGSGVKSLKARLNLFVAGVCGAEKAADLLTRKGGVLTLEVFMDWAQEQASANSTAVWRGLLAAGHDFHFDRCGFFASESPSSAFSYQQDLAVVHLVNALCRHWSITSDTLEPCDLVVDEVSLASKELAPLQGVPANPVDTYFCKTAQQMLAVPSSKLCVALASGGDPTYGFNVKFTGEEVHGTSGSFRQLMWQIVRELHSAALPLLMSCHSAAVGLNKGMSILVPGPLTYAIEKQLEFFGLVLGVAMRADVPLALDVLPCFWKALRGDPITLQDVQEADCVTYNLTEKMLSFSRGRDMEDWLSDLMHSMADEDKKERQFGACFVYYDLNGREVELSEGGRDRPVSFDRRDEYVSAVRNLRVQELQSPSRFHAIRRGMASVVPAQLLKVLTPADLDLRVNGLPTIDVGYLKENTIYQVGLAETDKHIQFFWEALESLSQDELRKFVKFACNQERIPFGQRGVHTPPFPMKIAPTDSEGPPNNCFIRTETCMFMIKLPQYTSLAVTSEKLRYAIHCREDPLSG